MLKTVVLLAAIAALTPLAIDMYLPAMPSIAQGLNVSLGQIQGSMSTFLAGFAIGQLIHGPISDVIGRRKQILIGLGLFVLASGLCALAANGETFLLMRVLQALGGAAGSVIINAWITDQYRGHEAVRIRSAVVAVMTLAPMLAPIIGGWLLINFGWRSIFWVLVFWGALAFVLVWQHGPRNEQVSGQLNWDNLMAKYRQVFQQRFFWFWWAGLAINSGAFFAFLSGVPYLYIEYLGIAPQHFGFYFAANVILMMAGSALNGRLSRYFGVRAVLRTAQTGQVLALMALAYFWFSEQLFIATLVPCFVVFIGLNAFVFPNATSLLLEHFREQAGTASALVGASQFGFGAICSSLVALGSAHGPQAMLMIILLGGVLAYMLICYAVRVTPKLGEA